MGVPHASDSPILVGIDAINEKLGFKANPKRSNLLISLESLSRLRNRTSCCKCSRLLIFKEFKTISGVVFDKIFK